MSIFDEPKIDCHTHVLDPARFPYAPDTHYRPAGQETGTASQLLQVMDAYGVRYALVVGTNSGYGLDNRCLLDAVARGGGCFKGIAVVANDIGSAELEALKAVGIIGVAFNVTHYGVDYYASAAGLLDKLAALDLFVQVQVEHDQLVPLVPMLERSGVRILIDHCGRPTPAAGLDQPGFRALLGLAATRRTAVKLSGLIKFSAWQRPACRRELVRCCCSPNRIGSIRMRARVASGSRCATAPDRRRTTWRSYQSIQQPGRRFAPTKK